MGLSFEESLSLFAHYRGEVRHEMELMLSRLNALLVSQSFLMIAYATSMMAIINKDSYILSLIMPPFLALLGFALAWEGRRGILAAQISFRRWKKRLDDLVKHNPSIKDWADSESSTTLSSMRAGERFALTPPLLFACSWLFFFFLPFLIVFIKS